MVQKSAQVMGTIMYCVMHFKYDLYFSFQNFSLRMTKEYCMNCLPADISS